MVFWTYSEVFIKQMAEQYYACRPVTLANQSHVQAETPYVHLRPVVRAGSSLIGSNIFHGAGAITIEREIELTLGSLPC